MVEQVTAATSGKSDSKNPKQAAEIINLKELAREEFQRVSTRLEEFDRTLGGGIVNGSVVLVSGDPGIGKSTLLSQLALNVENTLYVAGEESARQIKIRIDRLKKDADLKVLNEVDVDAIIGSIESNKPSLVIVDSIQTLQTEDLASPPGSVGQVRESAYRLQRAAKKLHIPIFIVGHVTKEGTIAGPKTLEHLVDVVLSLEGDFTSSFRILRANKNRFGPTDEVGIFEMAESGMKEVKNPSLVFLEEKVDEPGSVVIATMSGIRPILVEIQALVTKSNLPIPKRVGSGVDSNRLQLLVAVLTKRLNLPLFDADIYVNVTGGLKVTDPAADLGICLAIVSSLKNKTVPRETVLIGEIGLLGELRSIRQIDKRIEEAKKLGYVRAISPKNAKSLLDASKLLI